MERNQFEVYYQKYFDDVYRYVLTILKNDEDTKDVLQDTFLKLYQSNQEFESDQHVKSWLLLVSNNATKNIFKNWYKNKRVNVTDLNSFQTVATNDYQYLQDVFDLPLKYRQVIYLYYYEGYKLSEIAQLLNRNESTIKTQLSRGRDLLKGVLTNE